MFKVGDKVFDIMRQEWGVVERIDDTMYPVRVKFCGGKYFNYYTEDGRDYFQYKNPTLIFKEFYFQGRLQEKPRWRAEKGESYYTITAYGDVDSRVENFDEYDNNLFRAKNYFQTEEEAKESKIYKVFHHEEVKNDKV